MTQELTDSIRFRYLCRRLHELGPRAIGEVLQYLCDDDEDIKQDAIDLLECYAEVDADFVYESGYDDWQDLAVVGKEK